MWYYKGIKATAKVCVFKWSIGQWRIIKLKENWTVHHKRCNCFQVYSVSNYHLKTWSQKCHYTFFTSKKPISSNIFIYRTLLSRRGIITFLLSLCVIFTSLWLRWHWSYWVGWGLFFLGRILCKFRGTLQCLPIYELTALNDFLRSL